MTQDDFTIKLTRDQALVLSNWVYRMIGTAEFDGLIDRERAGLVAAVPDCRDLAAEAADQGETSACADLARLREMPVIGKPLSRHTGTLPTAAILWRSRT